MLLFSAFMLIEIAARKDRRYWVPSGGAGSGRILQSLVVEDPIDALLRRQAEERSIRRRPRGPRARSVIPNGTMAAVPTDSRQIPTPAKPSTGFTESAVSTDIVEPGRKS